MTRPISTWLRLGVMVALLVATAAFLRARGQAEVLPPREPLALFPLQVGDWQGKNLQIAPQVLDVLGAGEFAEDNYRRLPQEPPIDLFLAYFPSQRMGSTVHSPQNCLPGAGWSPLESRRIRLEGVGGEAVTVNRYVLSKGLERILVIYWYQAHGRIVASEYWAKFYLITDAIRMNRSDGALVRLITPIAQDESVDSAQRRLVEFGRALLPVLDAFIPR
jgi:EpsI family protein